MIASGIAAIRSLAGRSVHRRERRGLAARGDRQAPAAAFLLIAAAVAMLPSTVLASPLQRLIGATLDEHHDTRDSLAAAFNPVQLPLLATALAAGPAPAGTTNEAIYRALARWHFWTGQRWDDGVSGFWSVDPATVPVGAAHRGQVLAAHAALELAQIAALARLAAACGNDYDALVWWSDHSRLRQRFDERLYDPLRGVHTDLDSTGAATSRAGIDALVPLALGADAIGGLSRDAAWRLWTGAGPGQLEPEAARLAAIERADALNGWTTSPGSRLFEPRVMATLVHAGARALGDPALDTLVRDALGAVGLSPLDSLGLRLGGWTPRVALADVREPALARSRVAVDFLFRMGVLATDEADSLTRRIAAAHDDASVARAIDALTAALGRWRAYDVRVERALWESRRLGRAPLNAESGVFRVIDSDLLAWVGRALDRITEDVVGHHLRPRERAPWRARIEAAVAARRDRVALVLTPERGTVVATGDSLRLSAMWTDGSRLIGPRAVRLGVDANGIARGDLGPAPDETGIWRLVLEGLPAPLRLPAAVAVVDPLQMRITPVARERGRALIRVDVDSRLSQPTQGRIEVQPPLSFATEPSTRVDVILDAAGSASFDFGFVPSEDDGPGLYPVRWTLFDPSGQASTLESVIDVPFEWLRLGPLAVREGLGVDTAHPPDERIELARRFEGVRRTVGWSRLPTSRLAPDGWIRLADADDPLGVHYAHTAFTTGSREATLRLESEGAALVRVNGRVVARTPDWGGQDRGELLFGAGTNFVTVKVVGGEGRPARFRLDLRDVDGEPLHGVGNALEMLLDELAYLTRTAENEPEDPAVGRTSMVLVPFNYASPAARSVSVVGTFNGWSPVATRMVKGEDGRWQAKVRLRPGRFEYKFAVDGDHWVPDPANPERVDDGFGGTNSVIVVE